MNNYLQLNWGNGLVIRIRGDMYYPTYFNYLEYHDNPMKNIDTIIHFSNWMDNRRFEVSIFPNKKQNTFIQILLRLFLKYAKYRKKLSENIHINNEQ